MTNYSFTSFMNNNSGSNTSTARVNTPTKPQIKYYMDLCQRKRVKPKDISRFTFDQLRAEIEVLRNAPMPASQAQVEKIHELANEIKELGGKLKPITNEFIAKLTGGRDGSASRIIQKLFDMRTQLNEVAPPSEAQLNILVEWFLCPDIPFEDFKIEKRIYLDKLSSYCTDTDSPERLEQRAWRMVTPTEFAEQIRSKMTKREASRFIDDYRSVFYDWRKTRITSQQVKYIRELEERLANIYVPKEVEYAIVDGEIQQVTTSSSRLDYNPVAYEAMDDMQLAQMSYQEASEWIDRLKSELSKKNNYQNMHDEVEDVWGDSEIEIEKNRQALNQHDAKNKELNKLQDLLYSLEAILGYSDEEVHEKANELIVDDLDSMQAMENKQYIKNFFMSTVTADRNKDSQRFNSEMARIYNMCEEIPLALEILMA